MKIVLIDDDYVSTRLIQDLFEREGHSVIPFFGAEPALLYLESNQPDLVVTDVFLPDLDGVDLIKVIQITCGTPVVAISAQSDTKFISIQEQVLKAGALAFFNKPSGYKDLVNFVGLSVSTGF